MMVWNSQGEMSERKRAQGKAAPGGGPLMWRSSPWEGERPARPRVHTAWALARAVPRALGSQVTAANVSTLRGGG